MAFSSVLKVFRFPPGPTRATYDPSAYLEIPRIPVLELARVAVVARHGDKQPIAEPVTEAIVMPRFDVSASQVRDRIRDGRSIDFLTPAPVVSYIHKHSLYRSS